MRLTPRSFIWAVAAFSSLFQAISVAQLRQASAASSVPAHTVGAGDAAKAFATKAAARLRLLSNAANQVL